MADLYHWGAAEALKGCCIHTSSGRTGDHPLSHSNAENSIGGKTYEQQGTASPSGWGNYLWSQRVEKSDKAFLSPSHYQGIHHSRHHHTQVSAQQEGRPRYKTLTRLAWKEEERAVREIVFYNSCFEKVVYKLNSWECYRYLYPIYKPTPCFKLVKLEDLCALSPPSSLAGLLARSIWDCCNCFSDGDCVLLLCPAHLAPSGVHSPTAAAAAASCSLGLSLLSPPCPLVLSCLAPLWSSHALWSCPAWLHSGPPRVPRPRSSRWSCDLPLITKSIPPHNN